MMRTSRTARRGATVGLAIGSIALLTLTACGTTSGDSASTDETLTELGEAEGQVSILAWPGYVEDGSNSPDVDWVTPFEEETGCEVTSKTYGTSDEAVNLMKTGEYDVVAASGDATLRLIAGGDVAPATGTPNVTLPPTDGTLQAAGDPSPRGLWLSLAGLGLLSAAAVLHARSRRTRSARQDATIELD